MIKTYNYNGETWIDLDNGTGDEIHSLMDKYNIHPFVAKELTSATPKPRVEFHDDYIYCILHFPVWKHTHLKEEKSQEMDFIIGKETLITARYGTIDAIHKFGRNLEVNQILERHPSSKHSHSHHIFMGMLRELYSSLFEELQYIEDMTENITSKIFKGKEREMVISISEVTRTLLDFKRITDLHREVLEALKHRGEETFGKGFAHEMDAILLDYLKINTTIRSSLEVLRELRETNNSLLTTKQNETVKKLTAFGIVILPLNLITWIFAMRTEGMPIISNPNAFWIVLGIMITSSLVTYIYAKHQKWI